jgi:regulator of sigma E protease
MSWFLAFAGFAVLIILHEFGHFIAAKATGMRVERFYLFFPPAIVKKQRGETEYGIGAIPLGGFVKITGMNPDEELPPEIAARGYYHQPVWKRIVTIGAGPAMNILVAFLILFFLAFGITKPNHSVDTIESGAPAQGKLQPGDRIVSVDGVRGGQVKLANELNKHHCAGGSKQDGCAATTPAHVVVERGGIKVREKITPSYDAALGRQRLGFAYGTEPVNPSAPEAAKISAQFMWRVTSATVGVFSRLFEPQERKQISSVVGGYEVTRQAIEFDSRRALTLIAVISLSLGIINLAPFLPLDGGHIFWSLVEKVRGKPVPFSVMERAGAVGFVLVIFIFLIGLSNDIGRLTGGGFSAH